MDFTETMKDFKEAADLLIAPFGVKMDYTKKSLQEIEDLINYMFPKPGRPMFPTTLIPFGYYLGETLIRKFPNAKWIEAEDFLDIEVKIVLEEKQSIQLKPFMRVLKFFMDRTDSLAAMYELVELQLSGAIDFDKERADKKWKQKGNLLYRVTKEVKKNDDQK